MKTSQIGEHSSDTPQDPLLNLHQATIEIEGSLPGFLAPIKLNGTLI